MQGFNNFNFGKGGARSGCCGKRNGVPGFFSHHIPEKSLPLLSAALMVTGTVIVIVSLGPWIWLTITGAGLVILGIKCIR